MITRRNALWLIPLLIIITFPIWKTPIASFLSPRGDYNPQLQNKETSERNFSMTKVNILQSEEGLKTADIHAEKASTSTNPNIYVLKNVIADLLGENGKVTNIVADKGTYNDISGRLRLRKNVVVTSKADNFTLKTNALYYYNRMGKVHCPGKTVITGDGIIIKGGSFDYNIKNGVYVVGGRVYCTIQEDATP